MSKQHVNIIGPNLPDQSKGQFHVHAFDCRDGHRLMAQAGPLSGWDFVAENRTQVVQEVYCDIIDENVAEGVYANWWQAIESYEQEFHFAPCVEI